MSPISQDRRFTAEGAIQTSGLNPTNPYHFSAISPFSAVDRLEVALELVLGPREPD